LQLTITFENESDVIVYAFEKVIVYARRTQHIVVAQCVWWLASVIGLESGLIIYIDNLRRRERLVSVDNQTELVHPDRIQQIQSERAVSSTPRDLTEDLRLNRDRAVVKQGRVNPLPTTKTQLKKARKVKHLQEKNKKQEAERNQRLKEIRSAIIRNFKE